MKRVIINQSNNKISWDTSFFSKLFFDELYEKFKLDITFWSIYWLDLYLEKYELFIKELNIICRN